MVLYYHGDFSKLKDFGYQLDDKKKAYYKEVIIGHRGNKTHINTIYILSEPFENRLPGEIINIALNSMFVEMTLTNVDIADLIQANLVSQTPRTQNDC